MKPRATKDFIVLTPGFRGNELVDQDSSMHSTLSFSNLYFFLIKYIKGLKIENAHTMTQMSDYTK